MAIFVNLGCLQWFVYITWHFYLLPSLRVSRQTHRSLPDPWTYPATQLHISYVEASVTWLQYQHLFGSAKAVSGPSNFFPPKTHSASCTRAFCPVNLCVSIWDAVTVRGALMYLETELQYSLVSSRTTLPLKSKWDFITGYISLILSFQNTRYETLYPIATHLSVAFPFPRKWDVLLLLAENIPSYSNLMTLIYWVKSQKLWQRKRFG